MIANEGVVISGSRNLNNLVHVTNVPYPKLEDDLLIIKTKAFAVNPTDWKHILPESFTSQVASEKFKALGFGFGALELPLGYIGSNIGCAVGKTATWISQKGKVVGSDVSGVVVEVGKDVKGLKKGDIVSSSLHGGISKNGGFADYVMTSPNSTIKFPSSHILDKPLSPGEHPGTIIDSFESAASVGIGLKTVALSFYCNLEIPLDKTENKKDYVLIWGGATATGILAIQIAKLVYGINVITTASKKNHSALLDLGADKVFDYNDKDVIQQLRKAGENRIKYALDCVSSLDTLQSTYDATEGTENVVIDNLLFLNESLIKTKPRKVKFVETDAYLVDGRVHFGKKASPELMKKYLEFWHNIVPLVLTKVETAPLKVLPPGFESANEGLRLLIENKVSGQKVVFRNRDKRTTELPPTPSNSVVTQ